MRYASQNWNKLSEADRDIFYEQQGLEKKQSVQKTLIMKEPPTLANRRRAFTSQYVYQQIRKMEIGDDFPRIKKEWKSLSDEQKMRYMVDES